jgi:hypothetical protein
MLTKNEARTLVLAELERPAESQYPDDPTDLVVIDERTIERGGVGCSFTLRIAISRLATSGTRWLATPRTS